MPEGQARALRRAYELAGYGPETVEFVEAHGTATKAGDAAEFEGLQTVFNESGRAERQWCALGSVKSQIGHTKAAAGAAGLFKAVMALHHRVVPPIIKIDRPNPALKLEASPFHLPSHARPWVRDSSHPRRASVSSFGFGGSNFHVALEEYAGDARTPRLRTFSHELVVVDGTSGAEVAALARSHAAAATKDGYLAWLAHESQRSYRADFAARLAVVASDETDLAFKLEQAAARIESDASTPFSTPTGIHFGTSAREGRLAFLFPGQGSQYAGMGASLAMHFDKALAVWDRAAGMDWRGGATLHDVVFPRTAYDDETRAVQAQRLMATEWAQPAIGCMSLSLLALLEEAGLEADCFGGHSFGEVTALGAAGVLSEADVVRVARRRGELMKEAARTPGSMIAVPLSAGEMQNMLDGWGVDVVIANHNGPGQVVLSGTTPNIEAVETKLRDAGIHSHRLGVATAFHSPVVADAAHAFADWLGDVSFRAPSRPVYANTTARAHPEDASTIRTSLGEQLAHPVLFMEMIEAMYRGGVRTFVEVGPGSILTDLTARILEGRPHSAIHLDRKGVDGLRGLLQGMAALVAGGHPIDFAALWSEYAAPANPHDRAQPKLNLPINGSNYGKPYPPEGGIVPGPNPPRPSAAPAPSPAPAPAVAARAAAPKSTPFVAAIKSPSVSANAAPRAGNVRKMGNWAQAFESAQRQTADAHSAYIQAMARSHQAFLETVSHGFNALENRGQVQISVENQPPLSANHEKWGQTPFSQTANPGRVQSAERVGAEVFVVAPAPAADAVASAPSVPPSADLEALMLDIVSEKTGYPTEMLTMEMELEGDLGIDSIKRVEILAAMQERAPGLPEVEVRVMAKLRTLGQIVDYMNGEIAKTGGGAPNASGEVAPSAAGAAAPGAAPASAPSHTAPGAGQALGRYILEAVESSPIGMSERGILGEGRVVVIDDGTDLPECIVRELAVHGITAEVSENVPPADLRGVIFLGGLRVIADDNDAIAINREAFAIAKKAAAWFAEPGSDDKPRHGFFLMVQDTGGTFGTAGIDPRRAWLAGCAGLARTLAQEWPAVAVKAVDLERGDRPSAQLARALVDELLAGGPDLDVGLTRDNRRVVLRSTEAPAAGGAFRLADGDVVVASGGARGVTAATLTALAGQARLRFVLLGRTTEEPEPRECEGIADAAALKRVLLARAKTTGATLTPAQLGRQVSDILARREIRATIDAIEAAGSQARYAATDVTSEQALAATLAGVRETWGPIHAVVHGAGVIQDRFVAEKTTEQFNRVFDTKVKGLRALLAATAADPLKALCLFSSVAARCGNMGQSDYAMANEILNKVALAENARRGDACVVRSLGWGPWAGGMVSPELQARFETMGVPLIDLASGAQMFVDELMGASGGADVELVLGGRPRPEALLPSPDGRHLCLDVTVSRVSHPYLCDHSIRATPVVPVALAIEWFGRAARAFAPDLSLAALHDVKVLRGIPLRDFESGRLHLVVHCRQRSAGNDHSLSLELADTSGAAFYRCVADMVHVRAAHQGFTNGRSHYLKDLQLEAWGDRLVYDGEVLFHGPRFQMIRSIDGVSDSGIAAHLDGVAAFDWHLGSDGVPSASRLAEIDDWHTDPVAFDGGLQLALLWCKHKLGRASLPTSIASVRTWSDGAARGPIHCTVIGRDSRGARSLSDVVFRDSRGDVFAEFEGVETHLVPEADDGRA
ncbi:MAG: SDR family NAD(P)-dependent oxidoreductase [Candidatus Binatia bacterium]